MLITYFLVLLFCFWALAKVCDAIFVPSLEVIGKRLKMDAEVAGATLMAIGSSAPELFTSILALVRINDGVASLGSGTIVGSAIFNILVIVGASSLFLSATYKLFWQPVIRDMIFYLASIICILFFFWDGRMVAWEAGVLTGLYIVYIWCVTKWSRWFGYESEMIEVEHASDRIVAWSQHHSKSAFTLGIILIGVLSHFMVDAAVHFAGGLGISVTIIGLTILAAGTSVPDLLSSLIVARKGQGGMAVSNAIGSNIFDIYVGIGSVYLVFFFVSDTPYIPIEKDNLISSVLLLFATVISLTALLLFRHWRLGKFAGVLLLVLYVAYVVYIVHQVTF